MPVNLYGNIGTTYTGIVTGAELERVSQEIFGGAQVKAAEKTQPQQQVQTQQATPQQVDLYSRSTDLNLTQQVAQIKTDFNVQLSPQALQNIQALNAYAATQQASNVQRVSDGRFQPMVDNSQKSDIETIFAVPHPTTIIKSFSLDKDKKGSNPFAYTPNNKEEQTDNTNNSNGATFSIVA
ncbi:MAG: hypothetical protein K6A44_05645 [bacterium]|nr:hypothetical protein [bacterium]